MSALQSGTGPFIALPVQESGMRCDDFRSIPIIIDIIIIINYFSHVSNKFYNAKENVRLIPSIHKTETGLKKVVYQHA